MRTLSLRILRVGLGLVFIGVGFYIFQDPQGWGFMLQPWAAKIIGNSIIPAMLTTAVIDIAIGILLIAGVWVWLAALVGVLQLVVILITVGINSITIRDVGLLFAVFVLMLETLPQRLRRI